MRVLVVGSGGREHALVWRIGKSPSVTDLFCAPGNPGIARMATLVSIPASDKEAMLDFARRERIDLVVIGPEQPLADGIVDRFESEGLRIFGPSRHAAKLEWSKSFAKEFMARHAIPTAGYRLYEAADIAQAEEDLRSAAYPLVLKADGLAAGKGVMVCTSAEDGVAGVREIMQNRIFGSAGDRLLVEEFLEGVEASVFALADGIRAITLIPAQDYKRSLDGDQGKNTGGMGSYAPSVHVSETDLLRIRSSIVDPVIRGMSNEGTPYKGCLYVGLMMTDDGPKVVEFNSRFGDPETQVVLPLLKGDVARMLYDAAAGDLSAWGHQQVPDPAVEGAVCVVTASTGYPDSYEKGIRIMGLADDFAGDGIQIFHSGTAAAGKDIVTAGGRVLGVMAHATSGGIEAARTAAYRAAGKIHFEGMQYRKDIASKATMNVDTPR